MSTKTSLPAQPASAAKRRWPDMSFYGIHFGVVDMPNGEKRLVMVDEQGSWASLAQRMGFAQSRWFGLYVKTSLKLDIPGFATTFPSAKVIELADDEIRARIKPLILARKDQRLSQMQGRGRLSWHPNKTEVAAAVTQVSTPAGEEESLSAEAALRQTLHLGLNHLGQDVYESGDGQRFIRTGESVVARESADTPRSPAFLRASTDEDVVKVATGMVKEIDTGKRLTSDDFIRFVEAALGTGASEDKEAVGRLHTGLDTAMRARVASLEGAGRDAFEEALRLHEGRPSFWRAAGTWATPLPISVLMQSLAEARVRAVDTVTAPSIIDITDHPGSHSWSLDATSVSGGNTPQHDIALAGVFGRIYTGRPVAGLRVTRTDSEALLSSLDKRAGDGLTVFLMTAAKAGKMDAEFRRVISVVGQQYEISGLIDLDPAMIGPGTEQCSRLVVVGRKRQAPDLTFAVGSDASVIYDYDSLWNWGEALKAAEFGESQTFGEDDREQNRWQAPYIPSSQVSEPKAMSPRNLLAPVRHALAKLVERYGMGVDEFVCDRLGWTLEQMEAEERLDAEQVDAVALGIQAVDDGKGIVEADATGLGKGRVAAALALYAKRKGIPVMFMTEKSDLFGDFYRDVMDIGAMDDLNKPFIINNDLVVRHPDTGVEIARSLKKPEASMLLACAEPLTGFDIVMATYSQFNRVYDSNEAGPRIALARALRGVIDGSVGAFDALTMMPMWIGMPDYKSLGLKSADLAVGYERSQALAYRAQRDDAAADGCEERIAVLEGSTDKVVEYISARLRSDMTTLKHQWLYSGVMNGALLILDEAHVAAGEDSQTGINIRHLVENAGQVEYSSATYAKDVKNFILYQRLFPDNMRVATLGDVLERQGEPMQEVISSMLARDGRLIRREHDLSNVEFVVSTDVERLQRNEDWSNALAMAVAGMARLGGEIDEVVSSMNEKFEAALVKAKNGKIAPGTIKTGVKYAGISSKFYIISRAFSMAMNADHAADRAIQALREGRKPVITVENTMESVLRELAYGVEFDEAHGDGLEGGDPLAEANKDGRVELGRAVSFRDILHAYVDGMFGAYERVTKGSKVLSSKRLTLLTPEFQAVADQVHELIDSMPDIPLSPLDLVARRIRDAGYTVDEISGRRLTLERRDDGTDVVVPMTARKKQVIKKAFNNGTLDAVILSKAGSTGISLHAHRSYGDQSQRELIELQPAADIAQRLQFWGRVNRKGQVCTPVIRFMSSGMPAEQRLIMMQNSKLRRMSANISGNADNSAINDDAPDILNRIGNEVAFRWLEANPAVGKLCGHKVGEHDESKIKFAGTKFVDMLTRRIVLLQVTDQRRVYAELQQEFDALMEQYEMDGINPLKAAEYDLRATTKQQLVLQEASGYESVFSAAVKASEIEYAIRLPAIDRAEAMAAAAAGESALVAAYGIDYAETIIGELDRVTQEALPQLLPKAFSTIEHAIASDAPNAVKNAVGRCDRASGLLERLSPGSVMAYSDDEFGQKDSWDRLGGDYLYVTGWKVPQANKMSLAGYRIQGYSRMKRKRVEITLSSLMSRTEVWSAAAAGRDKDTKVAEVQHEFFKRTSDPINGTETRIVLEGNIYKASELAEGQRAGAVVTYSNEKGIWQHAVLMPRSTTINNVIHMPVVVDSVMMLESAIDAYPTFRVSKKWAPERLIVSDDFRGGDSSRQTYTLYCGATITATVKSAAFEKSAWLMSDSAVKECLVGGQFTGDRLLREGKVVPGMESRFLAAFMVAANKAGIQVLLDGYMMREWHNSHLKAIAGTQDEVKKELAVALADTGNEIDSLLAMAP